MYKLINNTDERLKGESRVGKKDKGKVVCLFGEDNINDNGERLID